MARGEHRDDGTGGISRMSLLVAGGLGLGAGLMYLLDPDGGRRRRTVLRDRYVRGRNVLADTGGRTLRDLNERTRGLYAEARNRLADAAVADETVIERVRARL